MEFQNLYETTRVNYGCEFKTVSFTISLAGREKFLLTPSAAIEIGSQSMQKDSCSRKFSQEIENDFRIRWRNEQMEQIKMRCNLMWKKKKQKIN